jgi:hypothetical protein
MRRRQIYAAASRAIHDMAATPQQAFAGSAALAKADDETIEQFVASLDLPPGTCPNCLKHVGKGIAIHKRNCKG